MNLVNYRIAVAADRKGKKWDLIAVDGQPVGSSLAVRTIEGTVTDYDLKGGKVKEIKKTVKSYSVDHRPSGFKIGHFGCKKDALFYAREIQREAAHMLTFSDPRSVSENLNNRYQMRGFLESVKEGILKPLKSFLRKTGESNESQDRS
jgi:hypothetical protein